MAARRPIPRRDRSRTPERALSDPWEKPGSKGTSNAMRRTTQRLALPRRCPPRRHAVTGDIRIGVGGPGPPTPILPGWGSGLGSRDLPRPVDLLGDPVAVGVGRGDPDADVTGSRCGRYLGAEPAAGLDDRDGLPRPAVVERHLDVGGESTGPTGL